MLDNDFDIATEMEQQSSYIKVIGVGGAGTNAVNHMYNKGITGVDFIVCNTDKQSLEASPVPTKIKLGNKDLGAGNDPRKGQEAAIEATDRIKSVLDKNTRMLFIAAGMGGGTGTGAAPEIAKIAKDIILDEGEDKILVVAVVTTPFSFEGRKRREQAKVGIENLKKVVDSIIVVNTDKLKNRGIMSMKNAFALADDVLLTAAKGISEIMTANAYIHVDFCDVQSVMQNSGVALMGSGTGEGGDRAFEAIKAATTSDLLNDNDLTETQNILLYVSCSAKEEYLLQTDELETITAYIQDLTNPDVDIIWGCGTEESLGEKLGITIVATGFKSKEDIERPIIRIEENTQKTIDIEPEPMKIVAEVKPTSINIVENEQSKYIPKEENVEVVTLDNNITEQKTESTDNIFTNPLIFPVEKQEEHQSKPIENKQDIFKEFEASEKLEYNTTSLKDLTSNNNEGDSINASQISPDERAELKRNRIKRVHDMLAAGNLTAVHDSLPLSEDFDEKISTVNNPQTVLTITNDGGLSLSENPVIGSQVD